ncbi:MAG: cytochrome b/b6 domain-containing protein [Lentimicrobium sp.]|jgi:thiosulfate reductase cytochrome b subunit|nr:cytochrome b/b6 domain-containing protein [Lentimicrobium sp.]
MEKIKIFSRFERFWHWTQMATVGLLTITGFEIHGSFTLLGFETSVRLHNAFAITFIILGVITIFWLIVTGQYKNFIPTSKKFKEQIRFYTRGIFKGEPHPTKKSYENKLNPIQRIVYLGLLILIFPVQTITGLLYMYYHYPQNPIDANGLWFAVIAHTFGAFLVVAFVIGHVYMTTTGHRLSSNIRGMITGYEEEPVEENKTEQQPA